MSHFSVGNIGQLVSSMVVSGETQTSLSVSEILNLIKSSPMRISIRNKEHKETYLTSGDDFTIGIERLPVGSALSRSLGHYDVCTLPMFKYGSMVGGGFVVRSVGSATAFRLNGDNVERVTDLNVLSTSPINNGSIKTTLSTKKDDVVRWVRHQGERMVSPFLLIGGLSVTTLLLIYPHLSRKVSRWIT